MEKKFKMKNGANVTVSIRKTTLKEKILFLGGVAIIIGIVWWCTK